jgi:hypothetical protein
VKKKLIKILKKSIGSVWFWFYKLETEKTEANQTQTEKNWKKPSQTSLNRFLSKKPNRIKTN